VSRPTQWLEGDTPPCLTTGRSALRPGLPRSGPARLRRGRYRNTLSGTEARHDVPDAGRLAMEHVGADPQAPAAQPQAPGRGRGSTGRTRRGARSGSRASRHEARGPERPSAGVPGDTGVRGRYPNGGARPRKHPSLIVIAASRSTYAWTTPVTVSAGLPRVPSTVVGWSHSHAGTVHPVPVHTERCGLQPQRARGEYQLSLSTMGAFGGEHLH